MHKKPTAKIVICNEDNIKICASAARISTTKGNSIDIFDQDKAFEENAKLVHRVMSSGHKSCIEHAVFSIAFCNVSAVVEEFIIEFRLASYTVKSRRYVDFSDMGYYVPDALNDGQRKAYKSYMDFLFSRYSYLTGQGIPKEDARFVLPYSFYSNFYCTLNARELLHILDNILYGRGRNNAELVDLAGQILKQLKDRFPVLGKELEANAKPATDEIAAGILPFESANAGKVTLMPCTSGGIKNLVAGYLIGRGKSIADIQKALADENELDRIAKEIVKSKRPRELEQLSYTFVIEGISLSGLTHLVRHRMQSIVVPELGAVDIKRYILPPSIAENPELNAQYHEIFKKSKEGFENLKKLGVPPNILVYSLLSGNMLDVMTTMNARELQLFLRLRTCSRAQWEIQDISVKMLKLLRQRLPLIFNEMGPSCFILGTCPEGKLSCGKISEMLELFKA